MRCFAECFISVFQHRIKDLFIKFKVVYDLSDVIAEYEVVGNDIFKADFRCCHEQVKRHINNIVRAVA